MGTLRNSPPALEMSSADDTGRLKGGKPAASPRWSSSSTSSLPELSKRLRCPPPAQNRTLEHL